jgi:hypothetical protein
VSVGADPLELRVRGILRRVLLDVAEALTDGIQPAHNGVATSTGVPVQMSTAPAQAVADQYAGVGRWPAGKCPKHERPWIPGQYGGSFCPAKDPEGNKKGYCALEPGVLWNGLVCA